MKNEEKQIVLWAVLLGDLPELQAENALTLMFDILTFWTAAAGMGDNCRCVVSRGLFVTFCRVKTPLFGRCLLNG